MSKTIIDRSVARPVDLPASALAEFSAGLQKMPLVLAQLGWSSLRPGQKDVIKTVMMGYDCVGILPTAAGKTGTYVVPALCMGWRTIIISPLLALMADQEASMRRMGVAAARITSDVSPAQVASVLNDWACGNLQIMLVSPERVSNPEWRSVVMQFPPDFIAMDEAHTFSNWADTFRSGYKFAGDFVREVNPKVVLALTATCPPEMEEEIREGLSIQNARRVFYYPTRDNLKLHTLDLRSPTQFAPWVAANCPGSTIVYCATRENVETMCADLQRYVGENREVVFYHGGITSPAIKKDAQDRWTYSDDAIIVATNAFGMGIDKPNVRNVVHFDLPGTLSALVQEAGRAGRDGEISHCWAYPNPKSISTQKYFIRIGNPTEADVRAVFRQFSQMQDMDGTIHANRMVVAQRAAVDPKLMGAVMTFMYGEKLVQEVKEAGKPARLKWSSAIPSFTPAESQTRDALDTVSREVDGWLEFDIEQLAKVLNLKPETVGSRLTSMASKGLFTYVRQDSRKPIRIIGHPDNVNFTRINQKAAEAQEKLDEVIAYCDVPDEDKHAYLMRTMKTNEPPPSA